MSVVKSIVYNTYLFKLRNIPYYGRQLYRVFNWNDLIRIFSLFLLSVFIKFIEHEYYQPEYQQNYRRKNPKECLLLSILAILCCLPLGVVALILSIKTREANRINDSETARKYSKWTITSSLLAIGIGVISAIFCLITVRYTT